MVWLVLCGSSLEFVQAVESVVRGTSRFRSLLFRMWCTSFAVAVGWGLAVVWTISVFPFQGWFVLHGRVGVRWGGAF
jgi:hypothetical protein